jgi:hypothetical protein
MKTVMNALNLFPQLLGSSSSLRIKAQRAHPRLKIDHPYYRFVLSLKIVVLRELQPSVVIGKVC